MIKEIKISDIDLENGMREDFGDIESLASSIKKRGLQYPIIVRKGTKKKYEIIDGFRRIKAFQLLGLEKILADDRGEIPDDERDFIQYIANEQSKYNTWWEKAQFYKKKIDEGMSQRQIAEEIGSTRKIIGDHLDAFRVFQVARQRAKALSLTVAQEISYAPREDWELLVDIAVETNASKRIIRKMIENCAIIKHKLELIENTHPVVHNMLYHFWYPLRYQIGSAKDMEEEADLRMGNPHRQEIFLDAEEFTEEEARKIAEEQHGEYRGIRVFKRHVVYGLKRTVEEIRKKWK